MLISVAIPCYKSEKTIGSVVNEIREEITKKEGYDYQIILVNDYPFDNTFSVIQKLCEEDPKIVGLNLSRNFGQAAAKMAALPYVKGDVLVYMDDDGQHPAEGIIPLAEKVMEGYDIVYAYFKQKKHSLFKRVTSKINSKIAEMNGTRVKGIHASSFLAISRFAVDSYEEYHSPFPSLMGYLNTLAGRVTEIEMPHRARLEGKSNYSLKKLFKLWITSFTNFSIVPLRAISLIGMFITFVGFSFGLGVIIFKLLNPSMAAGYASTMAVLLFLGGFILLALGFTGIYIGRMYMTISNLQPYRVRNVLNWERKDKDK
ncbi:MAG: glycosyltransferase family 2 protein [Ruminococcaceae bacterium]|nr:glycosyltransferase family 2 protein [Oscillospiraceae bacterium]